jgi:transposase-like protein
MGQGNFTEDFKLDAIKQITERGHSVADVSKRLGVSTHSLYSWRKRYAALTSDTDDRSTLYALLFAKLIEFLRRDCPSHRHNCRQGNSKFECGSIEYG